ncbi:energy-coupling factor transporter transmembrane protein EcfT [Gulosibacter sp. 10]|uniref:energy-coupling factor transporter transmembrane component T family protein n=1 Tax=Gulosibacter sp. 10 TaxID=1255570 RepID=UPI00097F3A77|nr:energy-coupling factor transporter transmembrane component T [Gulosibacter sp. 10]SJM53177.1 Transmembrane component BioN of energizing module of biotin ECF transporter [Gulosibacter sp. 10]
MISLYRHGGSPMHRLPAGVKLAGLAVIALAVSLLGHSWPVLPGAGAVLLTGYLATGFGLGEFFRQLVAARWLVVIMAVPQLIFLGADLALLNTTRVIAVVLFAALVTLTTPMGELLDVVERLASPLARLGVSPAKVGLLLGLTITTVPVVAGFMGRLREAMRARGGPRMSVRIVLPLLVLALQHGDELSDSLRARGLD